jgi:hypothetical protein
MKPLPMTLGNMRAKGVRFVYCHACHRSADVNVDLAVPALARRFVCDGRAHAHAPAEMQSPARHA